jgi:hypothetical protein
LWYLVYQDDEGTKHTVKGTVVAISKALADGRLGDASNVQASRTKGGPYESLRSIPEFRDILVTATPVAPSTAKAAAATGGAPPSPTGTESTAEGPRVPHITLGAGPPQPANDGQPSEWVLWVMLFALFAGTAAAAYWFWFIP